MLSLPRHRPVRYQFVELSQLSIRRTVVGCSLLWSDTAPCVRPWLRIPPTRVLPQIGNHCRFGAWRRIALGQGLIRIGWLRTLLHCSTREIPTGWLAPVVPLLGIAVEASLRILMIERLHQPARSTTLLRVALCLEQVFGSIPPQSQPLLAISWTISIGIQSHPRSILWPIEAFFRSGPACAVCCEGGGR